MKANSRQYRIMSKIQGYRYRMRGWIGSGMIIWSWNNINRVQKIKPTN